MLPREFLQRFAADVSKRCGICQATVEVVLPAFVDEIRYILAESKYPCIPIESFGTFAMIDVPERDRLYTYKGKTEIRHLPAKRKLKFSPTHSFRQELEQGQFDPSRKSFSRHPKDRRIRKRGDMQPRKKHPAFGIGPKAGQAWQPTKEVKSEE